jgi:hypothetical protein
MKAVTAVAVSQLLSDICNGKKEFAIKDGVLDYQRAFSITDSDLGVASAIQSDTNLTSLFTSTLNQVLDGNFSEIESKVSSANIAEEAGILQIMILATKVAFQLKV